MSDRSLTKQENSWRLEGLDTFEGEYYSIPGEHESLAEAQIAARAKLRELEKTQPSSSSGGQAFGGIQDRIFIVGPDGTRSRFV